MGQGDSFSHTTVGCEWDSFFPITLPDFHEHAHPAAAPWEYTSLDPTLSIL